MNYRNVLNMGVAALLFAACAAPLPENHFSLKGTITGVDGQEIYLYYQLNDSSICDTATIAGGAFEFGGELRKPMVTAMLFMGDAQDWQNKNRCQLYLEPSVMTVVVDTASFGKPVVTGSCTQAEADSVDLKTSSLQEQIQTIYAQMQAEPDRDKREVLEAQMEPLKQQKVSIQMDFIKTHSNSFLVPEFMRFMMGNMSYEEIKEVYDNLTDRVKHYGDVEEMEKELSALERVQPGQPAPEICKADVNGDTVSLSSLKGKYVLLDFWASWCVPCRKSFPHVKALYKKYHDKGFEVFCVADNDSNEDPWRKAIKDDGVEAFYHVLRGLKGDGKGGFDRSDDVSDLYAIHYLPTKYLIDRDGRIVGKLNDEELDAKLKEVFGE